MNKFRLHVEECVSRLNFLEIKTDLNERELDALLNKIEQDEVVSIMDLKRKLEAQGIKVAGFKLASKPFYIMAETLEIEKIEESKNHGILFQCKACDLSKEEVERAIDELKEKMLTSIEKNGKESDVTIGISQKLDTFIVAAMRSRL